MICTYSSKTELAIANAFIDLLKVKALEDIHINEICKKAKVTKTTFYNHFSNNQNHLDKIMQQSFEFGMNDILKKFNSLKIDKPVLNDVLHIFILNFFKNEKEITILLKNDAN